MIVWCYTIYEKLTSTMLTLAVMTVVLVISILQLLHHMNVMEGVLPGITHFWNSSPMDKLGIRGRVFSTPVKSDYRNVTQSWTVDKPCWPEEEVIKIEVNNKTPSQAVGAPKDSWYTSLLYVLYGWKSTLAGFPILTAAAFATSVAYALHLGMIMRILPRPAEEYFRSLLKSIEITHKDIETESSQTSKHLISRIYNTLEGQENRSLEIVMDILNEMNEGLTMQQWYEQEKLNIMMEDDVRAGRSSSKYLRSSTDVNSVLRDLNKYKNKREQKFLKLKETRKRAEGAFQKCYNLIGDLEEVRDICEENEVKRCSSTI